MSHIYVMSDYYPRSTKTCSGRAGPQQLARDIEASVTGRSCTRSSRATSSPCASTSGSCRHGVSENTNKCASAMLAAICISLRRWSSARQTGAVVEPIGFTLTSMGYVLIVYGIYYFLNTLDGIIMVRRAYTYEDGCGPTKEVVIRGLLPATLAQTAGLRPSSGSARGDGAAAGGAAGWTGDAPPECSVDREMESASVNRRGVTRRGERGTSAASSSSPRASSFS